uniref:cation:proton antiporter domain-containing protein n=1 Tax=Eubacterium sp. TaxID=142586 RepID=UPI004025DAB2
MLTSIAIMFLLSIVIGGIFKKIHMRDSVKLIIILSISFLFLEAEDRLEGIVPVSGLLAVMSTAVFINRKYPELAKRLSGKYNKLWVASEIVLFVLVGATVNLKYAAAAGIGAVVLILGALVFRTIGVQACLIKTPLTKKERIFCSIAYTPKATDQAAIGSVPLAMGLACGEQTLAVAVLAILITAPLGSFCIDLTYKKLLDKECKKSG